MLDGQSGISQVKIYAWVGLSNSGVYGKGDLNFDTKRVIMISAVQQIFIAQGQ